MNMMLSRPRRLALATLLTCTGTLASVNTAGLLSSAASPDCISWRISGICYWLLCTPFGCSVKTSVKVTHFIPQAVVSAYLSPGAIPGQKCRPSAAWLTVPKVRCWVVRPVWPPAADVRR